MRIPLKISRLALALFVSAFTLIGPLLPANACSCVQPDAAEFLANSEFVFVGSLAVNPVAGGGFNDVSQAPYTFEVDAVYKGDIRDSQIQVWSATNGAACGFELGLGEPVGVAASFFDGRLSSGLCSVVEAAELAAVAREQGIEPVLPDQTTDDLPEEVALPDERTSTGLAVGALATVVAGAGWFLTRQRRSS